MPERVWKFNQIGTWTHLGYIAGVHMKILKIFTWIHYRSPSAHEWPSSDIDRWYVEVLLLMMNWICTEALQHISDSTLEMDLNDKTKCWDGELLTLGNSLWRQCPALQHGSWRHPQEISITNIGEDWRIGREALRGPVPFCVRGKTDSHEHNACHLRVLQKI